MLEIMWCPLSEIKHLQESNVINLHLRHAIRNGNNKFLSSIGPSADKEVSALNLQMMTLS